jgi:hypothetical protein
VIGRRVLGLQIADAPALGHAARRARLVRLALVGALAALVAAAVALATRSNEPRVAVAPTGGPVTEVVLDVSGSVGTRTFRFTEHALRRLSRGGPVGLIVFSDSAEEALPPGTPAVELTPLIRLFRPLKESRPAGYPSASARYPMSPWYVSFSGGTRISAGLAAAREALTRDHVRGRIVLISDLADAADDLAKMKRELVALEQAGIELRVMPLPNTFARDLRRFRKLEGPDVAQVEIAPQRRPPQAAGIAVPASLAALAVLVAIALAANELFGVSLRWRERP